MCILLWINVRIICRYVPTWCLLCFIGGLWINSRICCWPELAAVCRINIRHSDYIQHSDTWLYKSWAATRREGIVLIAKLFRLTRQEKISPTQAMCMWTHLLPTATAIECHCHMYNTYIANSSRATNVAGWNTARSTNHVWSMMAVITTATMFMRTKGYHSSSKCSSTPKIMHATATF